MICGVNLDGRMYDVHLRWDRVELVEGGFTYAWWMVRIDGEPRPHRDEVREIYRRALELAHRAGRAIREHKP